MKKLELFEKDILEREESIEADDAGLSPEEAAFIRGYKNSEDY